MQPTPSVWPILTLGGTSSLSPFNMPVPASRTRLMARRWATARNLDACDTKYMESAETEIPQFRTKTGRCIITEDAIELERSGLRGRLASLLFGDNLRRHLVPFKVAGVLLLFCGAGLLFSNRQGIAIYLLILGAICLLNVRLSRNLSVASFIKRDAIFKIEPHEPKAGLARGYFVVYYKDNGQEKKRLIILPGSIEGGAIEYQLALATFRATGVISQNDGA